MKKTLSQLNDSRLLLLSWLCASFVVFLIGLDKIHPFIMLGIGALLMVWSLFIIVMAIIGLIQTKSRRLDGVMSIFFGLFIILFVGVFSMEPFFYLKNLSKMNTFAPACMGQAFSENPIFEQSQYNPLLGIDSSNTPGKWSKYPAMMGWVPDDANDVVLVACFKESERLIETCRYAGATVTRYQTRVDVTLFKINSGQKVGHKVFSGAEPEDCVSTVSGSGEINGDDVKWETVKTWLSGYVNPIN